MVDRKVIALDAHTPTLAIAAVDQQRDNHSSLVEAQGKLDAVMSHADIASQSHLTQFKQRLATQQTTHQAEVLRLTAERNQERCESAAEHSKLEAAAAKSMKKAADDARLFQEERAMSQQLVANQDALNKQIEALNAVVANLQDQVRDLTFIVN
ncbi:hypothetical protein GGI21_001333 [Coemansia aciculifera]|nr:hypothetical protein GGI21_001333 [Coemansia aciculifera]